MPCHKARQEVAWHQLPQRARPAAEGSGSGAEHRAHKARVQIEGGHEVWGARKVGSEPDPTAKVGPNQLTPCKSPQPAHPTQITPPISPHANHPTQLTSHCTRPSGGHRSHATPVPPSGSAPRAAAPTACAACCPGPPAAAQPRRPGSLQRPQQAGGRGSVRAKCGLGGWECGLTACRHQGALCCVFQMPEPEVNALGAHNDTARNTRRANIEMPLKCRAQMQRV